MSPKVTLDRESIEMFTPVYSGMLEKTKESKALGVRNYTNDLLNLKVKEEESKIVRI